MRNYNKETEDTKDHKYSYNFDFDVIHPLMMRSFAPFFVPGNVLELGSYQGRFTKRLLSHFKKVTCIEASNEAATIAKKSLQDNVEIIISTFEEAVLNEKFNNVVLTHVLEHIDDPVALLKKVRENWLSQNGKIFITCPNANAASRQIAVRMGLIDHNTSVTASERQHGHRITYTIETLARDARLAGLDIIHSSGIFFKALANFQWDQLPKDIISNDYLEACYHLGLKYPDLCSSIFLLCGIK